MNIAIDFDGTIVGHEFPRIGPDNPGAIEWMLAWQAAGANLILWTMRSDGDSGLLLTHAVEYCRGRGVEFFGINTNPQQRSWTSSPKAYAHIYVDDAAFGCPLRTIEGCHRPAVDWGIVGPAVMKLIEESNARNQAA